MRGGLASWESMAVSASMLEAVLLQVDARDGVALGCAFRAASALMHIAFRFAKYRFFLSIVDAGTFNQKMAIFSFFLSLLTFTSTHEQHPL